MEVFIGMNDNIAEKTELWADRIRAFQDSGLSRKDWCQQNGIPQSTFNYWFRKQSRQKADPELCCVPIFAKLPSEREISSGVFSGQTLITIVLSETIRMELDADCPEERLACVFRALKHYA